MKRISGRNQTLTLKTGVMVEFEEVTLSIEDGGVEAMDRGRPNGYLDGEVKAKGEITVDLENFQLITKEAADSGSYSSLPTFDLSFYAEAGEMKDSVVAYGCKLKLSDVINSKSSGGEKLTRKIPYTVTGEQFVVINKVPYLDPKGAI